MCQMASFIVTKQKVFWSKLSDSHEGIIAEFLRPAVDAKCPEFGADFVRTEITPPAYGYSLPLDQWQFNTDQDILPDWYDAEDAERRCRIALRKWAALKILRGEHQVAQGNFVAFGSASVKASGSATVKAWGSAQVEASDSVAVKAWGSASVEASDSATVEAWGSMTVKAWGSVTVKAWGSMTVKAGDSATVEAWGSAKVKAWDSATVEAWGSASVEAWNQATITKWSPNVSVQLAGHAVGIDRSGSGMPIITVAPPQQGGQP